MNIRSISITREGLYADYVPLDPSKPLRAKVHIDGAHGKMELNLPPEVSDRIVALIANEIVAATKDVARLMTSQVIEGSRAKVLA